MLVEAERVRLFTDFRYAESARKVAGVEFVETRRDVYGALGEILAGVRSGDVRRGGDAAASADAGGRQSSAAIRAFSAAETPAPLDPLGSRAVAQPLR